jgi:hypothetical protein
MEGGVLIKTVCLVSCSVSCERVVNDGSRAGATLLFWLFLSSPPARVSFRESCVAVT